MAIRDETGADEIGQVDQQSVIGGIESFEAKARLSVVRVVSIKRVFRVLRDRKIRYANTKTALTPAPLLLCNRKTQRELPNRDAADSHRA